MQGGFSIDPPHPFHIVLSLFSYSSFSTRTSGLRIWLPVAQSDGELYVTVSDKSAGGNTGVIPLISLRGERALERQRSNREELKRFEGA